MVEDGGSQWAALGGFVSQNAPRAMKKLGLANKAAAKREAKRDEAKTDFFENPSLSFGPLMQ